jgi:hypothetical protein
MVDISTVGTVFEIKFKGSDAIKGSDFSDDGTPFSIATKTQLTDSKKNMNGEMISSRTPSILEATLSVIPDGDTDIAIRKKLSAAVLSPTKAADIETITVEHLIFKIPSNNESGRNGNGEPVGGYTEIKLVNGRIKEGNIGMSVSSEGRKEAQEYTFEFEDIDVTPPATSGTNTESGSGTGGTNSGTTTP